ncbi:hypothetical protein F2P81_001171 [Scophthalmus maximus]|uniref:Uncharacterized protein n=1 Tax=Scophthalmus maximus TaxID=52904 RepID=A0A6A4TT82_SCOMX|nr:hypothetical protein F2P81_001171 [Scophthalmus maximus]
MTSPCAAARTANNGAAATALPLHSARARPPRKRPAPRGHNRRECRSDRSVLGRRVYLDTRSRGLCRSYRFMKRNASLECGEPRRMRTALM